MIAAVLLSAAALARQDGAPAPPPPVDCAVAPETSNAELAARLAALSERRADRVRAFSCGRSEGGREIGLVALTDLSTGPASQKPGLLLVPELDAAPAAAAAALAEMACELVERADRDPAVAALFARTSLYVLPVADPDRRAHDLGETADEAAGRAGPVELDKSFPAGWDPWRFGAAAGPYPLARAESRALARFLVARRNVAAVAQLGAGDSDPGAEPRPFVPDEDSGGSLLAFVHADLERTAFDVDVMGADDAARVARVALGLLEGLPQVALEPVAVERLKSDLVQVDVLVRNAAVPGPAGREPRPHALARGLRLAVEGADILATAVRTDAAGPFEVLAGDPSDLALGDLAAAGRIEVRLVARVGSEPTALSVALSSERGGADRLSVTVTR